LRGRRGWGILSVLHSSYSNFNLETRFSPNLLPGLLNCFGLQVCVTTVTTATLVEKLKGRFYCI
jgi:hypothetical protein